ncbi:MAG: response regulator [Proteobacteria bacterium]|nr:response regulator [Pseudomonadota bacterium]MBU1686933.1 response regulator [Pseudomonadota bacterium]
MSETRMRLWNRLGFRLSVFIFVLAVVPLVWFGFFTLKDIRSTRLQSVAELHQNFAKDAVRNIEGALADTIKKINLVLEANDLESADFLEQEWLFQTLLKSEPHLNSLTLTDLQGQELVKVGRDIVYSQKTLEKHGDHPLFKENDNLQPVIGAIHAGSNNKLSLDLYIPLFNPMDRTISAVLVAEIDIYTLLSFIADLQLGKTGYVYVVDSTGAYLAHPDYSVVLADEKALENPLVRAFVDNQKILASNAVYTNRKNVEVLSNAREVNNPRMLVVVAQSVEEAMAIVEKVDQRQKNILAGILAFTLLMATYFTLKITRPLNRLAEGTKLIGAGHFGNRIQVTSADELGLVTKAFNLMAAELETSRQKMDEELWLQQGTTELDSLMRGDLSLEVMTLNIITFMANYLQGLVGVLYTHDSGTTFRYRAGYSFEPEKGFQGFFRTGEGLCGQAALEKKILIINDIPEECLSVTSGLGTLIPRHLTIVPFVYNDRVQAVLELGSLKELTELHIRFLTITADSIAIIIDSVRSRSELNQALITTQTQAEELKQQQEELQASNEEMEEKTQLLMDSEHLLKEQQEELQTANEELEEKTQYLERNKKSIEEKNLTLEQLKVTLEKKAEDLAIASKYKSEFLANMSHELRTPLNSLLLLSSMLAENKEGNLNEDQVDSARIIHNSGNDLLGLINEILDLAKIEAGKMQLNVAEIPLAEMAETLGKNFKHLAEAKELSLQISLRENTPATLLSDRQRLDQILKNLIANACKFTNKGGVTVEFYQPDSSVVLTRTELTGRELIAIDVRDTGIGIPPDKMAVIFEAFQQIEGGTSRKYGGTGLGLSIFRELARLLGGEILLQSEENVGSTFTLVLPRELKTSTASPPVSPSPVDHRRHRVSQPGPVVDQAPLLPINAFNDDREKIGPEDKSILIIEDDSDFAGTLLRFCRDRGFKAIVSLTGEDGLACVQKYPVKAIILDIHLPGIDGWEVLELLKENQATRHIPVHFMSADDPDPIAFSRGAIGFLTKPISQEGLEKAFKSLDSMINEKMKNLLLVEDNHDQRKAIIKLIGQSDVTIREIETGQEALSELRRKHYDCMILDLGLSDMSGFELLAQMKKENVIEKTPIVIYTGRELTKEDELELRQYTESIIIKGARSEERLLDETSLFLHRIVEKMPEEKRKMISSLHDTDQMFKERTILIVDDDMRNVFALAKVLNAKGVITIKAENGQKALELLEKSHNVDLILMDIMMPVMDGYETMKRIRADSRFEKLPIIALTAKAMQRDKEDCIAAGANDYLAKPVDLNRLLSMMRVWLYR